MTTFILRRRLAASLALVLLASAAPALSAPPSGAALSPPAATPTTPKPEPWPPVTKSIVTKLAGTPVAAAGAPHHRRRRHRRTTAKTTVLKTVETANDTSVSSPSRGAYVNAALYYDYEPNRLYTLNASPHFLTAIMLRPGEKLVSKAAGDTVRWVIGETAEGEGSKQQVVVMVKPVRSDLRTNIILTTDQRIYILEAASHDGDAYTSVIAWNYPQEEMREAEAARASKTQVAAPEIAIDHLNFGYAIKSVGKPPSWQPLRVFDDGLKTYIQFPEALNATDAPPLFLIGPKSQAELVNYRLSGGYYVVDRLIDVAELRLGQSPQAVVRITRSGRRT